MCSTLLQLAPGSYDLPQAEKRITVRKAEQIHKMTTVFTQNDIFVYQVTILNVIFFLN